MQSVWFRFGAHLWFYLCPALHDRPSLVFLPAFQGSGRKAPSIACATRLRRALPIGAIDFHFFLFLPFRQEIVASRFFTICQVCQVSTAGCSVRRYCGGAGAKCHGVLCGRKFRCKKNRFQTWASRGPWVLKAVQKISFPACRGRMIFFRRVRNRRMVRSWQGVRPLSLRRIVQEGGDMAFNA